MARIVFFIFAAFVACSAPVKRYSAANLKVTTRLVHGDNAAALKITEQESPAVRQVVYDLIAAIMEHRKKDIVALVHPIKGALTDLKSPRSQKQIEQDLNDEKSVLYETFFSTKKNTDGSPKGFAAMFAQASEIQLDLFFYSPTEVEVRLLFENRPPSGILGNLILHKTGDRWFVAQFF